MNFVPRLAELLARATVHRRSLATAASAAFAGVAGAAVHAEAAARNRCAVRLVTPSNPDAPCNPPWGRYCSGAYDDGGPVGGACDGSRCGKGCDLDDDYYPQVVQSGCWCTALEREGKNAYSYWKCCDCACPGITPACQRPEFAGTSDCDPVRPEWQQDCGCRERVTVTFEPTSRRKRGGNR